jgi:hypothetical protein
MPAEYSAALLARFWSRVDKAGPLPLHRPDLGSCWLWTGPTNGKYGVFDFFGERDYAHRIGYQCQVGVIPEGLYVCHHCDTPRCVRGGHLFTGTHSENMQDAVAKGRMRGPRRPADIRGERNPMARLTADDVRAIRRRHWSDGVTYARLGQEYGVHSGTIRHICSGVYWGWLKDGLELGSPHRHLTPEERIIIVAASPRGDRAVRDMAERFAVHPSSIARVLRKHRLANRDQPVL